MIAYIKLIKLKISLQICIPYKFFKNVLFYDLLHEYQLQRNLTNYKPNSKKLLLFFNETDEKIERIGFIHNLFLDITMLVSVWMSYTDLTIEGIVTITNNFSEGFNIQSLLRGLYTIKGSKYTGFHFMYTCTEFNLSFPVKLTIDNRQISIIHFT